MQYTRECAPCEPNKTQQNTLKPPCISPIMYHCMWPHSHSQAHTRIHTNVVSNSVIIWLAHFRAQWRRTSVGAAYSLHAHRTGFEKLLTHTSARSCHEEAIRAHRVSPPNRWQQIMYDVCTLNLHTQKPFLLAATLTGTRS